MIFPIKLPENEPVYTYEKESLDRVKLKETLNATLNDFIEIPVIINGKEIYTGNTIEVRLPHNKNKIIGKCHLAGKKEIEEAIKCSLETAKSWSEMPYQQRALIFLKAADLLTLKYRYLMNAVTMLSISKTPYQSEIEAVCELADFWRFNVFGMHNIYREQPPYSPKGTYNFTEYRPLEGFVLAITPFNFTSIAGNLPTAPVIMGGATLWKPASSAVYAPYMIMRILKEAGLPDGVINFLPSKGSVISEVTLNNPYFAGLHFTGSTEVFNNIWKICANNIGRYKNYPRIVGETGGKDFIVIHNSANIDAAVTGIIRGAFEYQGQKCSAASRLYISESIWPQLKEKLLDEIKTIKMGDVLDFSNFMNAVIDKGAFDKIKSYIDYAKNSNEAEILIGGNCNETTGYFIDPTVILTTNPEFKTIKEEIFGPVVTAYVYKDEAYEEMLELCDHASPYGLTGAIFAEDTTIILKTLQKLKYTAGNFYINDKPTGAIVGQQPFGGSRASGTNDKSGTFINLLKWTSPRAIKVNLVSPLNYRYPFMTEK
jgi:1-pyrroline-5-carboxylate dehydrogenase